MELRKDIFTGKVFWIPPEMDFNLEYKIAPGTAVLIPKEFDWMAIQGKIDGITFITEGQTNGGKINFEENALVTNCKFLGNTNAGIPYGIRLSDPAHFGLGLEFSGSVEIAGVEVDGCFMGIHAGTNPLKTYHLPYENVSLHHNYIHNTVLEAFYIGQDQLGGPFITGDIRNNKVLNVGNDGIQCRNGSFVIEDNDIDGTGFGGVMDHSHGILNGGNTNNAVIRRNKLRNVKGFGVFANGYGVQTITDNDIQSGISGVFTKNFEYPGEDLQKVGFQKFIVGDNKISAANGKRIEAYYRENGCPVEYVIYGNTGAGIDFFMPGITVNAPPIPPPPIPEKEVYEKFYRIVNRKRKYYTLYEPKDGTGTYELKK